MLFDKKALVFDLDGTLVDSAPDLHRSLNAVLAESGRRTVALDDIRAMVGDGAAKLVERGFADSGVPVDPAVLPRLVDNFLLHYAAGRHALTSPFPGVISTLEMFRDRGMRLAVCTNKPYAPTMEILDSLGLSELFDAIVGGDSLPVRKPEPGHLLGTIALMGSAVHEAVMIGDSHNDIAVARAAGVPVIVVSYGYSQVPVQELCADAIVDDFEDMISWFDPEPRLTHKDRLP